MDSLATQCSYSVFETQNNEIMLGSYEVDGWGGRKTIMFCSVLFL